MTRTVWLASYPKSGNTWFRLVLSQLNARNGKALDINDLSGRGGIASARGPFDYLMLVESGLLTHDEADALRPSLYAAISDGSIDGDVDDADIEASEAVRMIKVHDAYLNSPKGEPLMGGAKGAAGAIVIVRDPRDVAPSLANHQHSTIDEAIDFMGNAASAFCDRNHNQPQQLRQRLSTWSGHIASWLDQTDIPVHQVRYEDMQIDPHKAFADAMAFAGWDIEPERIDAAIEATAFSKIQAQEVEKGFRETPQAKRNRSFFRRGQSGAWRDELTPEQVARIESEHAPMMARLGYRLSDASDWAGAQ